MQACFIAISTKSCNGCSELSKTLSSLSVHQEGMYALDVYKSYRTQRSTVKTSSNCSNRLCYQFPIWLTTAGTDLRRMLWLGRPICKQMGDLSKLTLRRLMKWTQGSIQNLKERWEAAREALARSFVMFVLWNNDKIVVDISSRC